MLLAVYRPFGFSLITFIDARYRRILAVGNGASQNQPFKSKRSELRPLTKKLRCYACRFCNLINIQGFRLIECLEKLHMNSNTKHCNKYILLTSASIFQQYGVFIRTKLESRISISMGSSISDCNLFNVLKISWRPALSAVCARVLICAAANSIFFVLYSTNKFRC